MVKTLILGTGPAGLTAAIYLARANLQPLVIEGPEPGGQLTLTTEVENFPGFPEGIQGPELMDNMRKQAERFGAQFKRGWVTDVDLSKRPFRLQVEGIGEVLTETLILSTGASAKFMGIPGERENVGKGVSTCATCDGFFFRNKKIVIVGGGDSAMEEANFLTKFASEVRVVHRRNELRASKIMQDRARANPKITWSLNRTPLEVVAGPNGVTGLIVKNNETGETEEIATDGIFVAIGHQPNTSFLKGQLNMDETGYLIVKAGTSETNVAGVFACGDVQDHRYRQAITAAGSGCMAALDCERYLELPPKSYQALHDGRIFFGAAADVEQMFKEEQIDVVVDLRGEATACAYPSEQLEWVQIPLGDNNPEPQDALFKQAIEQVVDFYRQGKKVAFHCGGGKGRTGTVAAGTLVALGVCASVDEAEQHAKQIRSVIHIKPEQKAALYQIFNTNS
jgi:thioredoxin reductase (NADPH)